MLFIFLFNTVLNPSQMFLMFVDTGYNDAAVMQTNTVTAYECGDQNVSFVPFTTTKEKSAFQSIMLQS